MSLWAGQDVTFGGMVLSFRYTLRHIERLRCLGGTDKLNKALETKLFKERLEELRPFLVGGRMASWQYNSHLQTCEGLLRERDISLGLCLSKG